jgi:hypothetical protein
MNAADLRSLEGEIVHRPLAIEDEADNRAGQSYSCRSNLPRRPLLAAQTSMATMIRAGTRDARSGGA